MRRIYSSELAGCDGTKVCVAGWLHRLRRLSSVTFLILRDCRGLAQIVVEDDALDSLLAGLCPESVLRVTATVVAEAQAPGGFELRNPSVEVLSSAAVPPPFELFRPSLRAQLPLQLDAAAVALRHPRRRAALRIAAASMAGFRDTLSRLGFLEIATPKIVASATEGGANVFAVDYFGQPAYLAQSPQFYKQTMVGVFERVFEVGPVFRAEPHDTPRHLSEYVSLDAEMGFIQDHRDVMQVVRTAVSGMAAAVREQAADAVALLGLELPCVPDEVPAIHFSDAQAMLARESGEDPRGELDLAPAHERWLGEWATREFGSEFLFVTGYPMAKRPFYTHPEPQRPAFSNSFDLLFRGQELVTGGQRLHRYEDYLAALSARGLDAGPFEGYLQAFRHGMPPHGGFAIGLERWVAKLVGAPNIREVALFPRDLHRLTP